MAFEHFSGGLTPRSGERVTTLLAKIYEAPDASSEQWRMSSDTLAEVDAKHVATRGQAIANNLEGTSVGRLQRMGDRVRPTSRGFDHMTNKSLKHERGLVGEKIVRGLLKGVQGLPALTNGCLEAFTPHKYNDIFHQVDVGMLVLDPRASGEDGDLAYAFGIDVAAAAPDQKLSRLFEGEKRRLLPSYPMFESIYLPPAIDEEYPDVAIAGRQNLKDAQGNPAAKAFFSPLIGYISSNIDTSSKSSMEQARDLLGLQLLAQGRYLAEACLIHLEKEQSGALATMTIDALEALLNRAQTRSHHPRAGYLIGRAHSYIALFRDMAESLRARKVPYFEPIIQALEIGRPTHLELVTPTLLRAHAEDELREMTAQTLHIIKQLQDICSNSRYILSSNRP